MAGGTFTGEWDFITLVTLWNFYGLPALLVGVVIGVVFRRRSRSRADAILDSLRTVSLVGLIHYGLTARALIQLFQELLTLREMGIPESFFSLISWALASLVNPLLGRGLRRRRPRARQCALLWYGLLSFIAIAVVLWRRRYHVAIDPARWPDYLVGSGLPVFLLVVMLLPRIKRVFIAGAPAPPDEAKVPSDREQAPDRAPISTNSPPTSWCITSLLCLLLLIIVSSTLVLDVADWASRLVFETE
jgi:hypothetical protein